MDLGDMFVSLAYVDRQIARDREELESRDIEEREGDDDGVLQALPTGERGVSGAMADAFDLQVTCRLLAASSGQRVSHASRGLLNICIGVVECWERFSTHIFCSRRA